MIVVLQIKAPIGAEQAVKEALALYCERFGDTRVLEIRPDREEQKRMWGGSYGKSQITRDAT